MYAVISEPTWMRNYSISDQSRTPRPEAVLSMVQDHLDVSHCTVQDKNECVPPSTILSGGLTWMETAVRTPNFLPKSSSISKSTKGVERQELSGVSKIAPQVVQSEKRGG